MISKSFLRFIITLSLIYSYNMQAQIAPANNFIAIDITPAQDQTFTYDSSFAMCHASGMRQIGLHLLWRSMLEKQPGVYVA
jgi:hypothetical protein